MGYSTATAENPTDKARVDLVVKLLARALDPAAHEGEANTSATMMVRVARRESISLPRLSEFLASTVKTFPPPPQQPQRPPGCGIVMTVGKHQGRTLLEIGQRFPGYLRWLAAEFSDDLIRDAAAEVVDYLAGRTS